MATQYNVSIILKVLAEGVANAVNLFTNLDEKLNNALSSTQAVAEEFKAIGGVKASIGLNDKAFQQSSIVVQTAIQSIKDKLESLQVASIGGTNAFTEIVTKIGNVKNIKLDLDSATALEQLKILQRELTEIIGIAAKTGNVEIFSQLSNFKKSVGDTISEIQRLEKEADQLERKPVDIRVKLAQDFPKVKSDITTFEKELAAAKEQGLAVDFRNDGATNKLNNLLNKLKELKAQAEQVGQDPIQFIVQINRILDLKEELKKVGVAKDRIAREEISIRVADNNQLKNLDQEARKLLIDLEAAKKAGNIKLVADIEIRRQNLQSQLDSLKGSIDQLGNTKKIEIFEGIQGKLVNAQESILGFGNAEASVAQKVQEDNLKVKQSLSDLSIQAKQLFKDIQNSAKTGNATTEIKLQVRADELNKSLDQIGKTQTLSPNQFALFQAIKANVSSSVEELNKFRQADLDLANEAQINSRVTINSFNEISKEAKSLSRDVEKAIKSGNFEVKPELDLRGINLQQSVKAISTSGQELNPQEFKVFQSVQADVQSAVEKVNNFTQASVQAGKAAAEAGAAIQARFREVGSEFSASIKELQTAQKVGEATSIKPKLEVDSTVFLTELKDLLAQAEALGLNVKPIQLKIAQVENFKQTLNGVTQTADDVAKKQITLKVVVGEELKEADREIRNLTRDIEEAVKKGDIRLTVKLQDNIEQIRGKLATLKQPVADTGSQSLQKSFDQKNIRLDILGQQVKELGNVPSAFGKVGAAARLLFQDIGGSRGVFTSFATGLRLIGTSSFLVGGQLRTLGFAFSAFGSIAQNFLPLIANIAGGLAKFGPPGYLAIGIITALAGIATVLVGKLLLLGAAFGALVPEGIKFNQLLEDARNATAAVAQQFFTFSVNGKQISDTIKDSTGATLVFTLAQQAATEQLKSLQVEALTTKFTTEELFNSFRSLAVSLGAAAPNIESVTQLTGQFARVAGVVGISAANLAVSVDQVVSGTGRATNALQRLFNRTLDTSGIALTSKRIKELRAEGGTVLFEELSRALGLYEEAARKANAESFTGVISNFKDLYQIVSGRATEGLFDTLTKGLGDAFNQIGKNIDVTKEKVDKFGNAKPVTVKVFQFSNDIEDIIFYTNELLKIVGVDIVNAFKLIGPFIKTIRDLIVENFDTLANIFKELEFVGGQLFGILKTIFSIFTLGTSTNTQFSLLSAILFVIGTTIAIIKGSLLVVSVLVKGLALSGVTLLEIFVSIGGLIAQIGASLPGSIGGAFKSLENFADKTSKRLGSIRREIGSSIVKDAADGTNTFKSVFKAGKQVFAEQQPFSEPFKIPNRITTLGKGDNSDDKDKDKARSKSTLAERTKLSEAITKLAQQDEENQLKLVQDRLKREQSLNEIFFNNKLISEQELARRTFEISSKETDNEIQSKKNSLVAASVERLNKEKQYIVEEAQIRAQYAAGEFKAKELRNKLEDLNLKQANDRISAATENKKIQGEIVLLEEQRTNHLIEYLKTLQGVSVEHQKQLEDQKKTIRDLQDINDEESLRAKTLDVVREKIDTIISLQNQAGSLDNLINTEKNGAAKAALIAQKQLVEERLNLLKNEISIRQGILNIQATQNVAEELFNRLGTSQNRRDRDVAQGILSERDALIQATAERIKYKEALEEALKAQEEALRDSTFSKEDSLVNEKRKQDIANLKDRIAALKTVVTDTEALGASNSIQNSLSSLFEKLQEDIGNSKNALLDFANSFLATFRKLIADRVVEEFFSKLFPKKGQTEGQATGLIGRLINSLGLGRSQDQKKAEELAKNQQTPLTEDQKAVLDTAKKNSTAAGEVVQEGITKLTTEIEQRNSAFKGAIDFLRDQLQSLGEKLKEINLSGAGEEAKKIVAAEPRVGLSSKTDIALQGFDAEDKAAKAAAKKALESVGGSGPIGPNALPQQPIAQNTQPTQLGNTTISNVSEIITPVSNYTQSIIQNVLKTDSDILLKLDSVAVTISNNFSNGISNLSGAFSSKLDELINVIQTNSTQNPSVTNNSTNLTDLFNQEAKSGGLIKAFAFGGLNGYVSGGATDNNGNARKDSILAKISNGEYVVQAPIVKRLGKQFFDYVNRTGELPDSARVKKAAGGPLLTNTKREGYIVPPIDTSKFNYAGGGADLINKPKPIEEKVATTTTKKSGGLRSFFGNLFSFAAPFLGLIPGVGPFLSLGLGALGGALSGQGGLSSVIGGVIGGLSNLGGFAGSEGKLGKLGDFFSKGTGKLLTGIAGTQTGNYGGPAGQSLLTILQKLGIFKKNAEGGIQKLADGGLGNSASGLLALFGLTSALSGLFKGNSGPKLIEQTVEDPDAERKNRYGSAYNNLITFGSIPGFNYSKDTLNKLLRQQEGLKNLVKNPALKGFSFTKLFGSLLPFIASIFKPSSKSNGSTKGLVDSPIPNSNPFANVFAANGGYIDFIQRFNGGGHVKGPGTGTSDSIPALLSNGEYVIKASSVRRLGTDILDSINEGRVGFSQGGYAGPEILGLPEAQFSKNNINIDNQTKIVNVLDPSLVGDYFNTTEGQKLIVNTIGKHRKGIRRTLS